MITIEKSTREDKKYQATDGKKTVHFGDSKYSDFTKHRDEERKKRYIQRHSNEDHSISNALSPAFLSRNILWNQPTVESSIRDLNKRYKVKFRLK
jgi:hypothetical protein